MRGRPSASPGDWRRRHRQAPGGGEPLALSQEAGEPAEEAAEVSRTLFSFLEPGLDTIASFGAAIVIAGIVGLVAGVTVVAFVGSMRTYGWIDIGIGGGLILLVALISLSSVMAAFFSRTGRYGINAAIMVAAFTGIIVVINFVSFENNRRMDVTFTNQFSLAHSTEQLLKDLDEPVRASAFYLPIDEFDRSSDPAARDRIAQQISRRAKVEETFRAFEAVRSSKFRFRFVDPTLEPEIVRQYFGERPTTFINETVVVEGVKSELTHVVQPSDVDYSKLEQDLYTSILVVSGREQKTVYFLAGHGERDIQTAPFGQDPDAEGYDSVREGLEGDNYDVRTLRWDPFAEDVSVPEGPAEGCPEDDETCLPGAALLVIAGPTEELPLAHAQALDRYLRGVKTGEGGSRTARREAARLIFLAEPGTPDTFRNLLASWGVVVGRGYIRDEARSVPDLPHTLQLQTVSPLDLLEELTQSIDPAFLETLLGITAPKGQSLGVTRMPGAAPVGVLNNPNLVAAMPLAVTSQQSYMIEDLGRIEPITDAGDDSDTQGPFRPVVYLQTQGPVGAPTVPLDQLEESQLSSMVVFGDSDFLTNANFKVGSGGDFFLNSANYLMGDYSLVSIRPKAFTFRELDLNRNEYNFVRFSSWFFMPGLLGLMAALVWWVRR